MFTKDAVKNTKKVEVNATYARLYWRISVRGDKETFESLRYRIGKTITPEAWPPNYSLDVCEHKFETPL